MPWTESVALSHPRGDLAAARCSGLICAIGGAPESPSRFAPATAVKKLRKKFQKKCPSNRVGLLLPTAATRPGPPLQTRNTS